MNDRMFQFGFLIGRFQFVHSGHERIIDAALALCKHVLVVIGSAQESGTRRNPFEAKLRADWLRLRYGGRIHLLPLDDYTHEGDHSFDWGAYLLRAVRQYGTAQGWPELDLIVEGAEAGRVEWFPPDELAHIGRLTVPRPASSVSATRIRGAIIGREAYDWQAHVHPILHEAYRLQRDYLMALEEGQ